MERTTHPFSPEEVMAYLDGELSPERAAATAAHLEHCSECRAVAGDLRGVARQLATWRVDAAPEALCENRIRATAAPPLSSTEASLASRDKKARAPQPVWRGILWWGGAIAVAALALFSVALPTFQLSREEKFAIVHPASSLPPPTPPAAPPSSHASREASRLRPIAPATKAPPAEMESRDEYKAFDQARNGLLNKDSRMAAQASAAPRAVSPGPMVIRRASLALLTKEFDSARASLENMVGAHQGYFGEFTVAAPANAGRSLAATVRVPASQLDPVLAELRKLGRVEQENQSADDVTRQYVDLTARLANSRETEKRLVEILRERTGKVSDVLDVEREISGVREQIEQMDAQRKTLDNQIQYASVDLRITEEYKQSLETPAPALGTRIHNAAVDGFLSAADLIIGLLLFVLNAGPTLALWGLMLAWPAWRAIRWLRQRLYGSAEPASQTA